jgi:hypothetical protein
VTKYPGKTYNPGTDTFRASHSQIATILFFWTAGLSYTKTVPVSYNYALFSPTRTSFCPSLLSFSKFYKLALNKIVYVTLLFLSAAAPANIPFAPIHYSSTPTCVLLYHSHSNRFWLLLLCPHWICGHQIGLRVIAGANSSLKNKKGIRKPTKIVHWTSCWFHNQQLVGIAPLIGKSSLFLTATVQLC